MHGFCLLCGLREDIRTEISSLAKDNEVRDRVRKPESDLGETRVNAVNYCKTEGDVDDKVTNVDIRLAKVKALY